MRRDIRPVDRLVLRLKNALVLCELSRAEPVAKVAPLEVMVRDALAIFDADVADMERGDEAERAEREEVMF